MTIFDVISDWFENLVSGFFSATQRTGGVAIRIFKKRSTADADKQVNSNARDIVLPSMGTAGEIVNDMANSLINAATVWKYQ